jgi:HAE1 family hydrophobic/amphiphilic exporter-1
MSGPTGIFYRQFSLTMAMSIILSGVVALTLTPALCTLIIKEQHGKKKGWLNKFFRGFNNWYEGLSSKYQGLLQVIANRRIITIGILLIFCVITGLIARILPSGFIPNEDQGTIYTNVITPPGATLERTENVVDAIQETASKMEPVASVSTLAGYSVFRKHGQQWDESDQPEKLEQKKTISQ